MKSGFKIEKNRNPRRDRPGLSSVTTAIHLLKTFTTEDHELGISELAKRLCVAKSTVHRLATALLDESLLQQNPENGRYRLGIYLFSLGSLVRSRLDVTNESKHILHELRNKTQENVRLAVLERQNAVFLHDFESPQTLHLRSETGRLKPAFCSAEGLCLLSGLKEQELADFFTYPRDQRTKNTVVEEAKIRTNIKRIKRLGYAVEDEECDLGTRCIAAPIFQADNSMIAAIGVASPRARLRKRGFSKLSLLVTDAAKRISMQLGYQPHQSLYL